MNNLKSINNFQIQEYAKTHNLPLIDIIMRDETKDIKQDGFYVLNLDTSKGNGTHWTAFYYHPLKSYYCDSFGFVPPEEVEEKIRPYLYNDKDIQDYNSDACGWYDYLKIKQLIMMIF